MLFPERAPKRIATPERKLELLAQQGVAAAVTQPFDAPFASMSAAQFEQLLFSDIAAHTVAVGANFTYGAGRRGSIQTLHEASRRLGGQLFIFSELKIEGLVVSSSEIRSRVISGDVEGARRYLGRPFELQGEIVQGEKRGQAMGFPTANVDYPDILFPKTGVYAVEFALDSEGAWRGGVANLGHKPTFVASTPAKAALEVHVPGAFGNWYGEKATVRFLSRLRDERRFASAEDLREQIQADILAAQPFLTL
jgi:riboflavin kinase/FMN adenylyltransferase